MGADVKGYDREGVWVPLPTYHCPPPWASPTVLAYPVPNYPALKVEGDDVDETVEGVAGEEADEPEDDFANLDVSELIDLAENIVSDGDHEHRHMLMRIMQLLRSQLA